MLILILFLFAVPLLFKFFTRKWINPYRLYLIFGKKGSGKSTYLVKLALRYRKKGWTVYTNMADLMVDGVRWFDIERLGDFVPETHSVLLLDEVGMIWDSRDFKKFKPSVRDFFKYQRHYHCIVYLASQTFDVDKKIRDLTDGMFLHSNVMNVFSLGKRIYKKVTLTESVSGKDGESRISEDLKFAPFWNWTLTYIPKYARYFDSFEIPSKPNLPYRELIARTPEKELKKLVLPKINLKRHATASEPDGEVQESQGSAESDVLTNNSAK